MRRFYAPKGNFADGSVRLDTEETRHLRDVLRLRVGDDAQVFDGEGREFCGGITEITKTTASLAIIEETEPMSPESPLAITVAATVLNGEKYDLIIQKAVELGVAELIPLHTLRCDVRPKDAEKRLNRWRRIALEATKQTGRAKIMQIAEPAEFTKVIESGDETLVLFSERDGDSFSVVTPNKKITAIFGPKGGWDDVELEEARTHGVKIVTLGGRVLRAETAAIAITAILQHRFGDLK
jgi:16S rRNA (uracil1498-N3)-methyltransferase